MNSEYLLFLSLYLLGLIIRTGYELFKKAGRVQPGNKVAFALVFAAMCLLWASWFGLVPLDPFRLALPDPIRWIGSGVLIAGFALAIGAFLQLRGLENISRLVTTGLFSRIRHPMYAGFIFLILGWVIVHGALFSLVFGAIGIGNILYWQRLEEEYLETRYGEDYRRYRQGTWF